MSTAVARPPQLFDVPAGAPPRACRSCGASIYFIRTARGALMPVDCSVPTGLAPTAKTTGRGASHFAICPNADAHRRPR